MRTPFPIQKQSKEKFVALRSCCLPRCFNFFPCFRPRISRRFLSTLHSLSVEFPPPIWERDEIFLLHVAVVVYRAALFYVAERASFPLSVIAPIWERDKSFCCMSQVLFTTLLYFLAIERNYFPLPVAAPIWERDDILLHIVVVVYHAALYNLNEVIKQCLFFLFTQYCTRRNLHTCTISL